LKFTSNAFNFIFRVCNRHPPSFLLYERESYKDEDGNYPKERFFSRNKMEYSFSTIEYDLNKNTWFYQS